MTGSGDDGLSGLALFAAELQAARTKSGMTRDELAAKVNYSASLIGMIEARRRVPRLDLAQRCDDALNIPGTLARLQPGAQTPLPA
jgi:ribosome-binding protein aMBF1 (putative translation factor)